jgi:hypothetical protein
MARAPYPVAVARAVAARRPDLYHDYVAAVLTAAPTLTAGPEYAQPAIASDGRELRVIYCFSEAEDEAALEDLPWDDAHRVRVIDATTDAVVDAAEAGR